MLILSNTAFDTFDINIPVAVLNQRTSRKQEKSKEIKGFSHY